MFSWFKRSKEVEVNPEHDGEKVIEKYREYVNTYIEQNGKVPEVLILSRKEVRALTYTYYPLLSEGKITFLGIPIKVEKF